MVVVKHLYFKLKKFFLIVIIIFSNTSFGKEFNELFIINEPISSSSEIEKTLNKSFNRMIYRLIGKNDPSYIWKIINSGTSRKDLIKSYSIKNINNQSFLVVSFDEKKTISKLRNLSVPIVGFDRPVIMILINFQPENKSPYFLSTNYQKSNFEKSLIPILNNLSKSKGVFLELPIFDLRDIKNNAEFNLLEDPKKNILDKYSYDFLVDINIANIGYLSWNITGDINKKISGIDSDKQMIIEIENYLTSKIEKILLSSTLDFSNESNIDIVIEGIKDYQDYLASRKVIERLLSINNIEIMSFANEKITYKANIFGKIETFKKEVQNIPMFSFINIENEQISLSYVN